MGIELRLGAKVDGKYEVIKKIGEGGFGVVYHVKQIADGAEFALKISDTFGVDDDIVKRMRREIRLMQKMNHPNVISVLDFGEGNDSIYLVMPLAKHAVSKEIKALAANPQQALQVFEEACIRSEERRVGKECRS